MAHNWNYGILATPARTIVKTRLNIQFWCLYFSSNGITRRRRDASSSIKFASSNIFVLPNYPKRLSPTGLEIQYTVLFPVASNHSVSKVLDLQTAVDALEQSKKNISNQLGVTLVVAKIVELNPLKNTKDGPTRKTTSAGIYVGAIIGALGLITLLAFTIFCLKRKRLVDFDVST